MRDVEKLVNQMNEGRLLSATEGVLVPMFERHAEEITSRLCSEFRSGKTNFTPMVAQLSYIREILEEIRRRKQKGQIAYEKLNQGEN